MAVLRPGMFALAILAFSGSAAFADTLDFSSLPNGSQGSTIVDVGNAVLTTPDGINFFVGAAGVGDEICAISGINGSCQADIDIVFDSLVDNLTLQTFGFHTGDNVDFYAYSSADVLIGSILDIAANQAVNGFGGLTGIKRLFIDDQSSGGAGFGYDNFQFNQVDTDTTTGDTTTGGGVPEPSTLLLLGSGLAFAIRRRQRNRA